MLKVSQKFPSLQTPPPPLLPPIPKSGVLPQSTTSQQYRGMEIKSSHSSILDLPPSCAAFCPSHTEIYVIGTYFLHPDKTGDEGTGGVKAPQNTTGSLILYELDGTDVSV